MKVCAVVVTYNRKELLMKCLNALLAQTRRLDRVVIIDNASSDGTQQALESQGYMEMRQIDYRRMLNNLGGAGGFYEGIKAAHEQKADWIWAMDDDTIPEAGSLEKLLKKIEIDPNASFYASCVKGPAGEPMNVPSLDDRGTKNGYSDWYMFLEQVLVKIKAATFVSILINDRAVAICGLPCKDFFIWGDDIEYTTRLTHHYGPAYLVGDSWVCHQRANARALNIRTEDNLGRLKNYRYLYRNSLILKALYEGKKKLLLALLQDQWTAICVLFSKKRGIHRFVTIERGIFGFFLEYRRFARQINLECQRSDMQ